MADADGSRLRLVTEEHQKPCGDAAWRTVAELGLQLDVAPPPRKWLLRRDDAGALAQGVVALLVAPGGRGKTMALVQLAIALATGRPWLGVFHPVATGRVVLALAEETFDEMRRRLYDVAQGLELSTWDRRQAERRIVPLPLAGSAVNLLQVDLRGVVQASPLHAYMLEHLAVEEHACVILDPLSRWAPEAESGNAAATMAVQCFEQFTKAPGAPTVVIAHHTAKWSRREGNKGGDSVGARGATGLTDAVRWAGALEGSTEKDLAFVITKSNYGLKGTPVELVRDRNGGVLRPPSDHELTTGLRAAIIEVLENASPNGMNIGQLRAALKNRGCGGRNTAIAEAVQWLVAAGRIREESGARGARILHLVEHCE